MVTVTDSACEFLADLLRENDLPGEVALRLAAEDEGKLGLFPDEPGELDDSFDHDGRTVLVIAPDVSTMLTGVEIDTVDTPEGKRLAIQPNEQGPN